MAQPHTESVYTAIPIGEHWMAIVNQETGAVVLQYLAQVPFCGTETVLNLMQGEIEPAHRNALESADDERFAVRTLMLLPDGSIACDPDAISPKGMPTRDIYIAFPPAIHSAGRYFSRRTGHNDW